MTIEVGYWKLRGLVGGIKVLLEYCGADWKWTEYDHHLLEDGSYDREEWLKVKNDPKFQEKCDFPNLPYMIDGDVCISQSTTILKYIARKFKVGADLTDLELTRVDLLNDQICDIRGLWGRFCYGGNMAEKQKFCDEQLIPAISLLDKYFKDKKFCAGEKVSYVDFMLWEMLDHFELFDEAVFDGLSNLKAFKSNVAGLPKVKEYLASDKFMKSPINGKRAKWGGDKDLVKPWKQ